MVKLLYSKIKTKENNSYYIINKVNFKMRLHIVMRLKVDTIWLCSLNMQVNYIISDVECKVL